ncbi:hypothetical protein DRN63_03970 [Nanoarchaeota archaeon]|nr:MAG: hypothetical protein DRN63_03970 [Nanoarchaeota archaeon]
MSSSRDAWPLIILYHFNPPLGRSHTLLTDPEDNIFNLDLRIQKLMIELRGIPASPGIIIGKVAIYQSEQNVKRKRRKKSLNPENELLRFTSALKKTKEQIKTLGEKVEREIGKSEAAIFEAHLMMLEDKEFIGKVINYIEEKRLSAEDAVNKALDDIIAVFESMESEYFKARADDLKDIRNRILRNLVKNSERKFELKEPRIVVASELLPSDTARMKKENILGLVTEKGSITSHAAIMARAMKVPAVVGVKDLLNNVKNEDTMIVDGYKGLVVINPTRSVLESYEKSIG